MGFLNSIFRKRKNEKLLTEVKRNCEKFREIMVEYQDKKIVYEIQRGLITYQNLMSPRDGGCHFPAGYFDAKARTLHADDQKRVHLLIDTAISQLMFTDTLDVLPPGASRKAFMRCTKNTGEQIYYSNLHLGKTGFSVQSEPIGSSFLELFDALSAQCAFVPLFDNGRLKSHISQNNMQNQRFFQETLWICNRCSTGNLLEHRNCIKCGAPRPW